jgi:catechol 2,3-dioxygenase-like lactoylglutathione lyase family enzyme
MLANHPTHATLPASDLGRAKQFYAEKLGLTPESETPGGIFYHCGGDTRFLYFHQGVPLTAPTRSLAGRLTTSRPRWPISKPEEWSLKSTTRHT